MLNHRSNLPVCLAAVLVTLGAGDASLLAHSGASGVRVDQETVFAISPDGISVTYRTELNRPGAYLEFLRIDADGDGRLTAAEQTRYFGEQAAKLPAGLELTVDGRQVPLVPAAEVELSMPFRKLYRFDVAHLPGWGRGAVVEFHNDNYLDFPGAVTVRLEAADSVEVTYDSRRDDPVDGLPFVSSLDALPSAQDRDLVFRYQDADWKGASQENVSRFSKAAGGKGASVPPGVLTLTVLSASVVGGLLLLALACKLGGRRASLSGVVMAAVAGASACAMLWVSADQAGRSERSAGMSDIEAGQIFQRLHASIYRSFAAPNESEIYDVLAEGLEGRVLDDVYNEVYAARMMRGRGTIFDVRRVKPISTEVLPAHDVAGAAFRVRYRWRVYGTVTHFGHTHARFNEYEALYLVRQTDRSWRISGSKVQQNKRVSIGQS